MPPQRFSTFPSFGTVGVSQSVEYDTTGATLPLVVEVTYDPDLGGFSVQIGTPPITVVPPPGCSSVTFEDMSGQSQAFTLPVI